MRPQDIALLLKILCYGSDDWYSKDLAKDLHISSAEVSNALNRNVYAGLLDPEKKKVRKQALLEFLIYGLPFVFPQRPSEIARGIPTAYSHPRMKERIISDLQLVWPDAESTQEGLAITPLYPGATKAVKQDEQLYLMLSLVEVLRIGKTREKKMAIEEFEKLFRQ